MEIISASAVPQNDRDTLFRYSRWRAAAAYLVVAAAAIGLVEVGQMNRTWLPYYGAAVLLIGLVIFQKLLTARFRPSNWLVRMTTDGLFIKFRSYLNDHFPDQDSTVVFIPYCEIRAAKLVNQRRQLPDRDGNRRSATASTRRIVELELYGPTRSLAIALANESKLVFGRSHHSGRRISTRYHHMPVQLSTGDILRVEWGVVPGAQSLLDALTRHTLVRPAAASSENYADLDGLSRQEQESRLLKLMQSGDKIGAVTLARRLYGYDLTQATDFVESLAGAKAQPR